MKRVFDLFFAIVASLVLAPLILALSIVILVTLGRPVFFRQLRPGFNTMPFGLIKFRTMSSEVDEQGELLPDKARLGRLGSWLRHSSLDELPELWNIIRGEMSFVGPRPLLMEYLPLYSDEQARRHEVRPGLTGWAQVNGRNSLDWPEKLAFDVWYVDNQSFALDMKILTMTIARVIRRDGITQDGHVTSEPFRGEVD